MLRALLVIRGLDDTGRIVPYLHPATRRRMLFRGALRRTESPEGAAPYRALRSTGFDKNEDTACPLTP